MTSQWRYGGLALALVVAQQCGCVFVDGEFMVSGPEVVGNFQRTEKVQSGVEVVVRNGSGDTAVAGGSADEVRVEGTIHVRAANKESADQILATLKQNPPIVQSGRTLTIGEVDRARFPRSNITFDFKIFVPKGAHLNSSSGSGDQSFRDLDGDVEVSAGSGNIEATNLSSRVWVKTGSGDIRMRDIRGEAQVTAASGDVTGENLGSRSEVTASSGTIRLSFLGDEARIKSASGGVIIREAKRGLRVRASSGDILIESLLTSGAVWDVESASGDVDLKLPQASQFQLDAESRSGSVESDFSVASTERYGRRSTIRGSIGQSASSIRLRTHSGRIRLRRTL